MESRSQTYEKSALIDRTAGLCGTLIGRECFPLERARLSLLGFSDLMELLIELETLERDKLPIGGINGMIDEKVAKSRADQYVYAK